MLKNFIFAAGALLVVTLIAETPATAATHRATRVHHSLVAHGSHLGRSRSAARLRAGAHGVHTTRRGVVLAHGYGRHNRRAIAHRDALIRRYVGPASSYERAAAPAGGAQVGGASYYGGGRTASGGRVGAATCAHRSLPFGTRVLVTNLMNLRTAILTVNDRGPFVRGRIVDVSVGAAGLLGMLHSGTARVSVQVVGGPG